MQRPNGLAFSRRERTAGIVKKTRISRAKRSAAWACSVAWYSDGDQTLYGLLRSRLMQLRQILQPLRDVSSRVVAVRV